MMARMMLNVDANNVTQMENSYPDSPVAQPVQRETVTNYAPMTQPAPENVYADSFPDWDLLPPQILIRRVNRQKQ